MESLLPGRSWLRTGGRVRFKAAARDSDGGLIRRACLSVCLSVVKMQNAIFSKTKQRPDRVRGTSYRHTSV